MPCHTNGLYTNKRGWGIRGEKTPKAVRWDEAILNCLCET